MFFGEDDYVEYRSLIAQSCRAACVEVWGYCLMPNHIHLILVPADEGGLRAALRQRAKVAGAVELNLGTTMGVDMARSDRFLRRMGFRQTGGSYVLGIDANA